MDALSVYTACVHDVRPPGCTVSIHCNGRTPLRVQLRHVNAAKMASTASFDQIFTYATHKLNMLEAFPNLFHNAVKITTTQNKPGNAPILPSNTPSPD